MTRAWLQQWLLRSTCTLFVRQKRKWLACWQSWTKPQKRPMASALPPRPLYTSLLLASCHLRNENCAYNIGSQNYVKWWSTRRLFCRNDASSSKITSNCFWEWWMQYHWLISMICTSESQCICIVVLNNMRRETRDQRDEYRNAACDARLLAWD
jgi:hypothetical protein